MDILQLLLPGNQRAKSDSEPGGPLVKKGRRKLTGERPDSPSHSDSGGTLRVSAVFLCVHLYLNVFLPVLGEGQERQGDQELTV